MAEKSRGSEAGNFGVFEVDAFLCEETIRVVNGGHPKGRKEKSYVFNTDPMNNIRDIDDKELALVKSGPFFSKQNDRVLHF